MKTVINFYLLLCCIVYNTVICASLNRLYHSDQSNYGVGMVPHSASINQQNIDTTQTRTIIVTGMNKKKLRCIVPSPLAEQIGIPPYIQTNKRTDKKLGHAADSRTASDRLIDAMSQDTDNNIQSISTLLHSKFVRDCIDRTIDYWTYEICPFKQIIQYHKTTQQRTTTDTQFSLGQFVNEHEGTDKNGVIQYTQHYSNGDNNRHSAVHYICDQSLANTQTQHLITTVTESPAFTYHINVHSPYVCQQQQYQQQASIKPQTQQHTDTNSHTIVDSDVSDVELGIQLLHTLIDSDDCLTLHSGWWHYYLCFAEDIIQAHRETDPTDSTATMVTNEYKLGTFGETIDNEYIIEHTELIEGQTTEFSYLSQLYVNGTICAVNGQARQTELRLYCDTTATQPTIKSIDEVSTCTYVMTVGSNALCAHPKLQPHVPTLKHIVCEPYTVTEQITS